MKNTPTLLLIVNTAMSECTIVFIREKGTPLLKYRDAPSYEERRGETDKETDTLLKEIETHNNPVDDSLGPELIHLYTTSSQRLTALPSSDDPKPLTMALLNDVLSFYYEKIKKISEEIKNSGNAARELEEELNDYQNCHLKFMYIRNMMYYDDNMEKYELVYRKY